MKRWIRILSLAVLMALCASAFAQVDLEALQQANMLVAVPDAYPSTEHHVFYYDVATGEVSDHFDIYVFYDEDIGLRYTIVRSNGDIEVIGGGVGYGYLNETKQPYAIGFVGCAYEEKLLWYGAQNIGEFLGGEVVTAEETASNGNLLLTVETPITSDMPYYEAFAGQTLVAYYTVNPENLIILAADTCIRGDDGALKPYSSFSLDIDPAFELPFDIALIREPEAVRELHVIVDPGTDAEFDDVLEAPLNMPLGIYEPDGYALYEDAAGTILPTLTLPDENGNYPVTSTLYCIAKAE